MRESRIVRPGLLRATPGLSVWAAFACAALTSVSAVSAQQPRTGGTAVIAGASDLQNLNSIINTDAWTREFIDNALFLRLVTLNRDLSYARYPGA